MRSRVTEKSIVHQFSIFGSIITFFFVCAHLNNLIVSMSPSSFTLTLTISVLFIIISTNTRIFTDSRNSVDRTTRYIGKFSQ